jgi:cell division protein FtsZ
MFEIIDKEEGERDTVIKVIGIGGAGGNAVDHMIREGVNGVDFITANTDSQALGRSIAVQKLQLGKTGLGAGAKPEAGRSAAIEEREAIAESLRVRTWSSSPPAWGAARVPAPRRSLPKWRANSAC